MILGIGIDTIEIARVLRACERSSHFVEAVAKAFRTGFYQCEPREIEVLRGELEEPYVRLYGKAKKIAKRLGITQIHISITNTKNEVTAFVVATDEKEAALQPLYDE